MGPDPIQSLINEDQKLKVGDTVMAHWNRNGFYFHARGKVAKLKPYTVKIELQESPGTANMYNRGDTVELPRISNHENWSSDSCVRRLPKS